MDAIRLRPQMHWTAVIEWAVAASFLIATVAVAILFLAQLRPMPSLAPRRRLSLQSTPFRPPCPHDRSPCRCCRSSMGRKSGSGKPHQPWRCASAAPQRVAARKSIAAASVERLTRFYEYSGSRFVVVFEPFERNGEARVSAIYVP